MTVMPSPPDDALRSGKDAGAAGDADAAKDPDLLAHRQTGLINALRVHLAEYNIISSKGLAG